MLAVKTRDRPIEFPSIQTFFPKETTVNHSSTRTFSIGAFPMFYLWAPILLAMLSALAPPMPAHATEIEPDPLTDRRSLAWAFAGSHFHQFDTDVDAGGSFEVNRSAIHLSHTWYLNYGLDLTAQCGYSIDDYIFSGSTGLVGLDPWNDIRTLRFGGSARWRPNDHLTVVGGSTFRFSSEGNASLSDGFQAGGFTGFAYEVNDTLTIGPGLGAITQIEDVVSMFPILIIDWKITDNLIVSTGRGGGATQGPGLTMTWHFAGPWAASIGGRYQRYRFRLDNNGIAPNGIGQEKGLPLYATLSYDVGEKTKVSVVAGVHFAGELKVENSRGNTVAKQEYDPAPFVGILGEIGF